MASEPPALEAGRRYRVATDAWVPRNAERYLGAEPAFAPLAGLRVKSVIAAALAQPGSGR